MKCAHVEADTEILKAAAECLCEFFQTIGDKGQATEVWEANKEVVTHANILRNHDLQEPAMAVLPITKDLVIWGLLDKLGLFISSCGSSFLMTRPIFCDLTLFIRIARLIWLVIVIFSPVLNPSCRHNNVIKLTDN
jgi:hypothetical protein